jgi:hypothetical protein
MKGTDIKMTGPMAIIRTGKGNDLQWLATIC